MYLNAHFIEPYCNEIIHNCAWKCCLCEIMATQTVVCFCYYPFFQKHLCRFLNSERNPTVSLDHFYPEDGTLLMQTHFAQRQKSSDKTCGDKTSGDKRSSFCHAVVPPGDKIVTSCLVRKCHFFQKQIFSYNFHLKGENQSS